MSSMHGSIGSLIFQSFYSLKARSAMRWALKSQPSRRKRTHTERTIRTSGRGARPRGTHMFQMHVSPFTEQQRVCICNHARWSRCSEFASEKSRLKPQRARPRRGNIARHSCDSWYCKNSIQCKYILRILIFITYSCNKFTYIRLQYRVLSRTRSRQSA